MHNHILNKYKIKAKKSLGQNFLVDDEKVESIGDIIEVNGKNIVEVGPGYGALTQKLLYKKPKSLNLVELDTDMINILEDRIESGDLELGETKFKINNIDILKFEPGPPPNPLLSKEGEYQYSVIANIPYYITSPILRHFLYEVKNKPEKMVILMQKDVGDKILGKNKNKSSVLSLFIDKKCKISEKLIVPKECFVPVPKVESSVLLFESHDLYRDVDDEKFLELIKAGFSQPRKKLVKNLINNGGKFCLKKENILKIFEEMGLDNGIRGEDLGIEEWVRLLKLIGE